MAACTKVAAFGAILRVLHVAFGATRWEWRGVLWAVAIVSMVIGAVLGLTQTDIKRMLAYSSVAHAGFLLVGAMALTPQGVSGTLFYLLAYGFTTLAAFGVITLVRDRGRRGHPPVAVGGPGQALAADRGDHDVPAARPRRHPADQRLHGQVRGVRGRLGDGMAPLVVIALVASAVAAFFYLRVIVLMYFSEPAADGPTVTVPGAFTTAAITLGVLLTLLLGIAPSLALDWASGGGFVG